LICLQTAAPGVSVAQVALRDTVNANLIFTWLRDRRYRPAPGTGPDEAGLRFLPVEIVKEAPAAGPVPSAETHIEIELSGGHRMRISGTYDPEALARLIRGLTA
jgi:transposase